jgi:predicted dehydrogenase
MNPRFSLSPSSTAPLRFALVGCGTIAATQARALAEIPDLARLTHCTDAEAGLARDFATRFSVHAAAWSDVLDNPEIDAVSICTPSGHHGLLGAQALAAGKHVIIEKPMEVTVAACDALLAAQSASARQLAIVSQHRFDPASELIHRHIRENNLGRVFAIDARVPWFRTQQYYDSGDWRGTVALDGGGCLMNQGIHTVDLLLWLAGPVVEVYARTATAAHERIEVEDLVCATLTFANGGLGTLFASTAAYPGFPARLALHGTEGTAILEGDELHTLAIRGREPITGSAASAHALQVAGGGTRSAVHHAAAVQAAGTATTWKWDDAHRAQFADFVASIRENRPPLVTGQDGRAAVALIQAVYESARTGRPVRPA